ncbi:MAG: hypothetical protein ABWZ91_07285 [Nocardioides sp.]
MLALYARGLSSAAPPGGWGAALVLLLAVGWALFPESVVGGVALLVVGWTWSAGVAGGVPAAALGAAAAMLAAHLAAVVIGYGPARLPVPPGVARLWAVRGVVVFIPAVLVWLLARGVRELPDSSTVWVVGLGVAVSVTVVAAAVVQALSPQVHDE